MKFCTSRNLLIIFIVMSLITVFGTRAAFGDDGHGHNHHDGGDTNVDTNVDVTGGDVNVPVDVNTDVTGGPVSVEHKSDSLGIGLSNSLGDVDIADCLASHQWSTPLFGRQDLKLNQVCMAEFYLRTGKYELAAMSLCNVKEILREFGSEQECEQAHNFSPPEDPEPSSELLEQRQEIEMEHEEDIEVVQIAQAELEQRITALETRPEPRPRVVRAPAPKPEPAFSQEQIDAAWLALKGSKDEDND